MNISIIVDTREKNVQNKGIESYFQENNINYLRSKLPYGDYALINDYTLSVDFKSGVLEIAYNLTHEHDRFKREVLGANTHGIGLVVLIAEEKQHNLDTLHLTYQIPRYKSDCWQVDKKTGKRIKTHYKGQPMAIFSVETIGKIMKTMQEKYGVLFVFTTKEKAGKDIVDILYNNRDYYKKVFEDKLNG